MTLMEFQGEMLPRWGSRDRAAIIGQGMVVPETLWQRQKASVQTPLDPDVDS